MAWYSGITNAISYATDTVKRTVSNLLSTPVYSLKVGHVVALAGTAVAAYYLPSLYQQVKDSYFPEPVPVVEPPSFIDQAVDFGVEQLKETMDGLYKTYNKMWYISVISTLTLLMSTLKNTAWSLIDGTRLGDGLVYVASLNPFQFKKGAKALKQEQNLKLAEALNSIAELSDGSSVYVVMRDLDSMGHTKPLVIIYPKEKAKELFEPIAKLDIDPSIEKEDLMDQSMDASSAPITEKGQVVAFDNDEKLKL